MIHNMIQNITCTIVSSCFSYVVIEDNQVEWSRTNHRLKKIWNRTSTWICGFVDFTSLDVSRGLKLDENVCTHTGTQKKEKIENKEKNRVSTEKANQLQISRHDELSIGSYKAQVNDSFWRKISQLITGRLITRYLPYKHVKT